MKTKFKPGNIIYWDLTDGTRIYRLITEIRSDCYHYAEHDIQGEVIYNYVSIDWIETAFDLLIDIFRTEDVNT